MANSNTKLSSAKKAKKDDFYTQLPDIEAELQYYQTQFKDKTVFCNCDDPFESNFFRYFALQFKNLHLQKLICTCYCGSPFAGDELNLDFTEVKNPVPTRTAYKIELTPEMIIDQNGDNRFDKEDLRALVSQYAEPLHADNEYGAGDFRSQECVALLQQADIVCTNPPFSLFRAYVAQLMQYNKKFLIIGNMNSLTYREIFPLIQNNQIWAGYHFNVSMVFKTTYKNTLEKNRKYVRSKGYDPDQNFVKTPAVMWYTNLETNTRHQPLILVERYTPEKYPKYDNYDAIEVGEVTDIPKDYFGVMGVPITFVGSFCPEQFEIIGRGGDIVWAQSECQFYTPPTQEQAKIFKKQDSTWRIQNPYYLRKNGTAKAPYSRIFIRKK